MELNRNRFPAFLAVLALVLVVAVVWAATALSAGGGSSSTTEPSAATPVPAQIATPEDCPEDWGGGSGGSTDSSGAPGITF
jgi:hypothetical protein